MAMNPGPDMEHDPQLAALYRAGTDAEPPAHLDDAIRAAARREVAAGPRRAGVRRWAVPVSLAAVLVLSVSVVTLMREQGADRPESLSQPALVPQPAAVEAPASPSAAASAGKTLSERRPVAPPAEQAPVPAMAQELAGRVAEAERGAGESRAKAMAGESSNQTEEPAAARRDYAPLQRSAPAPMADTASAAGASAVANPAAVPSAALPAVPAKAALWQDLVRESPEKWIQRISELRRDGKTADAEALLAEFRRRFPDARLPADLR